MAVWPSTITIRRDGFTETPPKRQLRSNMEVGPDKIRRRSSAAIRPVTIQLLLNDSQLDTFDTFYLDNDAVPFDFVNPRTGVTHSARFTDDPPTYSSNETLWDVKVSMELLP